MPKQIDIGIIKNELQIYWKEPETESKLHRYIEEGKTFLNEVAGKPLSFDYGSTEGKLLIAYVDYSYNRKGEFFQENYAGALQQLRLKHITEGSD